MKNTTCFRPGSLFGNRIRLGWLFAWLTLLFIACSSSPAKRDIYGGLGNPDDLVPFMSGVRRGTLPNGMEYYILKNSKPENRAFLTLAVNAGSILEQEAERGYAHFIEHLAFENTASFPNGELLDYLRSLGMRFGPDINAYTSYDSTVYGIEVPTETGEDGIKRIPPRALEVIDDWTWGVIFNQKEVDEERPVVLEEHRTRLGADQRIIEAILPVLLEGSPYWERSPIGLPERIENASPESLEAFYKTWYRPDNMALIFVGDFDDQSLENELTSHFHAPEAEGPLNRPFFELPDPQKGSLKIKTLTDPEYPYNRIDLYYKGTPVPQRGVLSSFRTGVMDMLIGEMISLRFDEAVLDPECPYIAAGVGESRYALSSRFYNLSVIAKPGKLEESLRAVLREKESLARYGFTNGEIDRAKNSLLSSLRRMVSEKDRQESKAYLSDFTAHFLTGQNCADLEWELESVSRLLPGIAPGDLAARTREYYAPDDLTVIQIGPESEAANLLTEEAIRGIIAASVKERISRPRESIQTSEFLERTPQSGSIIEESRDEESGTLRWKLSNGAEVILKETSLKNNEITLVAMARGGITSAPEEEDISVSMASEILEASGAGPYTRTEIIQKLSGKQVSLGFNASYFYRTISGGSTVEDMQTFFELLHLYFTQPRIDEAAMAAIIDQHRATLAQRKENPEAVFYDELMKFIYGNNLRFKPLETEDLAKADIEQARRFIERALNPGDYTFIFTGNLDIPQIRAQIETYLASIPSKTPWNSWDAVQINRPGQADKRIYKGKEEQSYVYLGWFLEEEFSEKTSLAASVLTEYIDIKLTKEIREKLGGVYSIGAEMSLSPLPPPGSLSLDSFFMCDPKRAEELIAAVTSQFELIAAGTIDSEVFATAAETRKKSFEESLQSNIFIARNYANLELIYNLPLSQLARRPEQYAQVTPEDLQNICRLVLAQGRSSMVLYPEDFERVR